MKKLVLIRHAKSSWKQEVPDEQRPLSESGKLRAEELSHKVQNYMDLKPYNWFSSPANRAETTAKIFSANIGNAFTVSPPLYTFNKGEVLQFLNQQFQTLDKVLIFGHNPAYTDLMNYLGDYALTNLPTCGIVAIDCNYDGSLQTNGKTTLILTHKLVFNGE